MLQDRDEVTLAFPKAADIGGNQAGSGVKVVVCGFRVERKVSP